MTTYIDSRIINLNSDKATTYNNGTYLSNLIFSFPALLRNEDNILNCQLGILNAQFPVSFYIINEYNNYLQYVHNGTTYNLYVPYGNYNSSTLSSYLQTTLTYDSSSNWTITINKATGLFTFTSTQSFTLKGAVSTIASILGISKTDNNSTLILPYTLTCPYPVNLLGIKKLKVASVTLAVNSADSWAGGFCNIIGTVPVNQPSYGLIQYMNSGNPHGNLRSKTVDLIDIQILDEFNNLVNFNNVNWTLSLELIILRQLTITPFNFPTQNILELPQDDTEQQPDKTQDTTQDTAQDTTQTDDANSPPTYINNDGSVISPDINNDLDLLLYNNQL